MAGLALAAAAGRRLRPSPQPRPTPARRGRLLAVATAAVAAALAAFDRRWRRPGLAPALLAVTAAGIWATVPDVEAALVLLGATVCP